MTWQEKLEEIEPLALPHFSEIAARLTANRSTEGAVEDAIDVYREASMLIDDLKAIQDVAKLKIAEVIEETGRTTWDTAVGKVAVTKPSTSVRWNGKALEALMVSDDGLARLLAPHRTVSERPGTLRITGVKGD